MSYDVEDGGKYILFTLSSPGIDEKGIQNNTHNGRRTIPAESKFLMTSLKA